MSENIALKIRFVLLDKTIVSEVLACDKDALGYYLNPPELLSTINDFFGRLTESDISHYVDKESRQIGFQSVREMFDGFADNNAFHGKDKPVPRIKREPFRDGDGLYYAVIFGAGEGEEIGEETYNALCEIAGKPLPIYEDKPKFSHEWKQIYPRTFDEPETVSVPVVANTNSLSGFANGWRAGVSEAMRQVEVAQDEINIEIWEFTMWSN